MNYLFVAYFIYYCIQGAAGSGKTQICYLAIARSLLDILKNKEEPGRSIVVVFHSEGFMPGNRLRHILRNQITIDVQNKHLPKCPEESIKCPSYHECCHWEEQTNRLLEFVFVFQTSHVGLFNNCISEKLPALAARFRIRMLVVDSVAGIYRSTPEEDTSWTKGSLTTRSSDLFLLSSTLRRIASEHASFILITNQVTSNLSNNFTMDKNNNFEASLGLSWSSCVNTRIRLKKLRGAHRVAQVERSPYCPDGSCELFLGDSGCQAVADDKNNQSEYNLA